MILYGAGLPSIKIKEYKMMKKTLTGAAVVAAIILTSGCSDKPTETSFKKLCISEMTKSAKGEPDPKRQEMAEEICSCSAPYFDKMSDQSKAEFMKLSQNGEQGHLTNRQDEEMLGKGMTQCAMLSLAKAMRAKQNQQ
jgi:hypothetical protein